jgi:hypothetical protein
MSNKVVEQFDKSMQYKIGQPRFCVRCFINYFVFDKKNIFASWRKFSRLCNGFRNMR